MIVIDASAMLELLLVTADGSRLFERIFRSAETLHAPELLDLEVAQVLRRLCIRGDLEEQRAETALVDLSSLVVTRYTQQPFLPRIWELRHNLTAYDAAYVALAEVLEAPLVTRDARLAAAPNHRAEVEIF